MASARNVSNLASLSGAGYEPPEPGTVTYLVSPST
jgi:hypothetical protein